MLFEGFHICMLQPGLLLSPARHPLGVGVGVCFSKVGVWVCGKGAEEFFLPFLQGIFWLRTPFYRVNLGAFGAQEKIGLVFK